MQSSLALQPVGRVDPVRGSRYADGFEVPGPGAAEIGELFITAIEAGTCSASHTSNGMRDSAILPGERLKTMDPAVHLRPKEIDDEGACIKLERRGDGVDALTSEQGDLAQCRDRSSTFTVTEEASWRLWVYHEKVPVWYLAPAASRRGVGGDHDGIREGFASLDKVQRVAGPSVE